MSGSPIAFIPFARDTDLMPYDLAQKRLPVRQDPSVFALERGDWFLVRDSTLASLAAASPALLGLPCVAVCPSAPTSFDPLDVAPGATQETFSFMVIGEQEDPEVLSKMVDVAKMVLAEQCGARCFVGKLDLGVKGRGYPLYFAAEPGLAYRLQLAKLVDNDPSARMALRLLKEDNKERYTTKARGDVLKEAFAEGQVLLLTPLFALGWNPSKPDTVTLYGDDGFSTATFS